jgi:hypothetical protein
MTRLVLLAALFVGVTGCGSPAPVPAVPTPAAKLPPEVEYDPATAAAKYNAGKKPRR